MALVCANGCRPERPKPVLGTKGDSVCLWCRKIWRDKAENVGGD